MSIGQIAVQLPFGSVAEKPAPVPAEPMHAENRVAKARQFESVMRKVAQHETAHAEPKPQKAAETSAAESGNKPEQATASRTAVEREPQRESSTGEKAEPAESAVPQKEKVAAVEAQLPEAEIPQNVVISAIGMQTAPLVQLDGRMPELQTATPQTVSTIAAANAAEAAVTLPGMPPIQKLAAEPVQLQPVQQLKNTPVVAATQVPTADMKMPEAKPVQTQAAEAAPVVAAQGDTIRLAAKLNQSTTEASSVVVPAASSAAAVIDENKKTAVFADLASSPKQVESGQKPEQAASLTSRPSAAMIAQPVETAPETIRAAVVPSADTSTRQSIPTALAAPVVVETTVTPAQPDMVAEAPVAATTAPTVVVEPVERPVTQLTNRPEPVQSGQNTAAIKVVTISTAADAVVQTAENTQKPAGAAIVAPVIQTNRTESVLDAYYQTAPRPSATAVPVTQPVVSADQVVVAAATPAVTETQTASPAPSGDNARTIAADAPVSRPVATTVAAPATPVTPAAQVAEALPEPVTAMPVTQTASSAPRVTVVPLRNPEKNVQEISQELQIKESDSRVSEQNTASAVVSLEEAASLGSGENFAGSENSSGQNLNGQAHLMAAQQHKTEQASSIAAPVTRDVREPVMAEPTEQHVVQQVKDHLTGRDFKTGTEQVTIRLTPEHMGELKLNLKMENQQIRIEIVAEKSMVRDALIKHSESLRETLAKQNITMESFNVSTGGNGNQSGRNQNDWRELAMQRQQNAWMASGGYRTPEQAAPSLAAVYQARPEHAMVDLHF